MERATRRYGFAHYRHDMPIDAGRVVTESSKLRRMMATKLSMDSVPGISTPRREGTPHARRPYLRSAPKRPISPDRAGQSSISAGRPRMPSAIAVIQPARLPPCIQAGPPTGQHGIARAVSTGDTAPPTYIALRAGARRLDERWQPTSGRRACQAVIEALRAYWRHARCRRLQHGFTIPRRRSM